MLAYDPLKRPTASECLQHSFFKVKLPFPLNAPDIQEQAKAEAQKQPADY